jgi:hypothetical protein
MNTTLKEQLHLRVNEARATAQRAVADARATTESTRSTAATMRIARKRRWTIRYQQAFVKNNDRLSELDRPVD